MSSDSESDTEHPVLEPVNVLYCGVCGRPCEYCEFFPGYEKECKPWQQEHAQEVLQSIEETKVQEGLKNVTVKTKKKREKTEGGNEKSPVIITIVSRSKRKNVTHVSGLGAYGIKLNPASKEMRSKFACGCSVVRDPAKKIEEIVIQGDVSYDLIDHLVEKYGIDEDVIQVVEGKKKGGR